MILTPFEFLPTVIGYVVYWIAFSIFRQLSPEGMTARNWARIFQISAVSVSGFIVSPITLNPFSVLSTLFYVGFLTTNLIVVNLLINTSKFMGLKFTTWSTELTKRQELNRIIEWARPYFQKLASVYLKIKEYIEKVKSNPIVRFLLSTLKVMSFLMELFIYPYIIRPFAFDLFISLLHIAEKWIDWLSKYIFMTILGEVVTKAVQIASLLFLQVPRYVLEFVRTLFDKFFRKKIIATWLG